MMVYTEHGERVVLADKPLAQGGEGAIYKMNGRPRLVAKIYLADAEEHREKIEAMVSVYPQIANSQALEHIAWPMGALYADASLLQLLLQYFQLSIKLPAFPISCFNVWNTVHNISR